MHAAASTSTYWYVKDHLGSVVALTDKDGRVAESYRYDAWGRVSVYDASGAPLAESAVGNRILWQGREYSWKTGLYYFRARWYDPVTGRFISKDPSGIANGLNEYVALNNNPLNFVDPTGEAAIEAAAYWAGLAGNGYNQGGFAGWWKVQTGNTMGMFINMWHATEIETHAGLAGQYSTSDECRGNMWKELGRTGGYVAMDYLQFAGAARFTFGGATRAPGQEFSHWIPKRLGGPRTWWNGRLVSATEHALNDPHRYRFMPAAWKAANPMNSPLVQQWNRMPGWVQGSLMMGGAAGADAYTR